MLNDEIEKAILEFLPLYDEVTTSDLQGITEARAFKLLKEHELPRDVISVLALSDRILSGIYDAIDAKPEPDYDDFYGRTGDR